MGKLLTFLNIKQFLRTATTEQLEELRTGKPPPPQPKARTLTPQEIEEQRITTLRELLPGVPESQITGRRAKIFEFIRTQETKLISKAERLKEEAIARGAFPVIPELLKIGTEVAAEIPAFIVAPTRFAQETARGAAQLVSGLSSKEITRKNIRTGETLETFDLQLTPKEKKKLAIEAGKAIVLTALVGAGLKFVKVRKITIPSSKGEKIIRTLGVETKRGRAAPLISIRDGRIKFGRVDITRELRGLPEGFEIKPGSALETRIIKDSLRSIKGKAITPRAREAIPIAQRIIRKTQKTKSSFIGELPKRTERLNEAGTKILYDIAREERGLIFGSGSRKAQQFGLKRGMVVRDIDIRIEKGTPIRIAAIRDKTVTRLRGAGFEARPKGIDGVEVKVKGVWKKVVEFKTEGFGSGETVPANVLGFDKFGKPIKISGIQASSLAEELRGVTQGVIRVRKKKGIIDIFPPEGRLKDVQAVVESASTLRESQFLPRIGLKQDIQEFRALFPEAVFTVNGKELVASFRNIPSAVSAIPSPRISPFGITSLAIIPTVSAIPSPTPVPSPIVSPGVLSFQSSTFVSPRPSPAPSPTPSPVPSAIPSPAPSALVSPTPSPRPRPSPFVPSPFIPSPRPSPRPSPPVSPRPSPPPSPISPAPSPFISPIPSPVPSPISPFTPPPSPFLAPPRPSPAVRRILKKVKETPGFELFVKRRGKFLKVPGLFPKGKALQKGALITRGTLAATFKVVKTKKFVAAPEFGFTPSPKVFRQFKIVKGKRVPLKDIFIQRAKFRLGTEGEIGEIMGAKRRAPRKKKNNPRKRRGADTFFR